MTLCLNSDDSAYLSYRFYFCWKTQVVKHDPSPHFSHLFIVVVCSLSHLFTFPKWRHSKCDITTLFQVLFFALASKRGWLVGQSKNHRRVLSFHTCFTFLAKNLVFFPRILVPVIQYDDRNHLPTVRAGDGVTYIFPLVDTLLMAWLATASQ